MASSSSSKEKHNFQCVTEASLELTKLPLVDILRRQIKPEDLFLKIKSSLLLSGRNKLHPDQLKLCYFPPPLLPDYSNFDVTLLYTLIRNLCSGLEPTRGWGHEPGPTDTKIGDDVERLRLFRNRNIAHVNSATIPDDTFDDLWRTLKAVLIRLQSYPGCRVDYEQDLIEIKRSQFRNDIWEHYRNLCKLYLEIEKEANERAEPSICIKGEEQIICGDTAEFKAEVKRAEKFSFPIKWQRRRGQFVEIIDTTLEKYSGSTDTRLIIPSVCKEDALEYQASLSDGNNHTLYSNTINLHVLGEKPVLNDLEVTTEDKGIIIHYSFEVSKNSPPVRDITWSKNAQPMYIKDDKFSGGSLHDIRLVIISPSEDDKGNYSCTVTNDVGSETKYIILDVPCVEISIKPTVHFASDTTITSIVTSMPPPEKAQWQKSKHRIGFSEVDVTKSKYFGSNASPQCPSLVIPKTTFDDIGYYRLQISNKLGLNVSNSVYLNVTGSLPNITVSHVTDFMNRSIKLNGAVFVSDDSPGIQEVFWSKNGEKIDIQGSGGRLSGVTIDDPSLTIRNVSQEDAGKYLLTAINAVGPNDSAVISIDVPYLYIRSEEKITGGIDCMCFTVEITSNPGPCHAQWNFKSRGEETFSPLDVNAEKYQGSTNSLPHPKLFIKEKDQLKKKIYQIKVTNFVGSTVEEISDDEIRPLQKQEENKLFKTADVVGNIAFAKLNNYLAMKFPKEKLSNLKCLLLDTKQIENAKCLKEAKNARECFSILHDENLFTRNDVILMQFLCKETRCDDLYKKCIEYAKKYKALCFIENPPDNGYKKVEIHIQKDFKSFGGSQIQEIVKIVAAMLDCEHEEILVVDARPSGSVILILSVKEKYAWKFTALNEEDCQKLRKLKIDYLIMDGKSILLETSTEISERKPVYIIDETCIKYRVYQCSKCPGDTEYFCVSCPCSLCPQCKENHVKDFKTIDHDVVSHRDKINYIPTQEICVRHPSYVSKKYCEPCQVPVCYHCRKHRNHRQVDIRSSYYTKRQQHRGTFHTIRSEALFNRPVILTGIKLDFKTCHTEFSLYQSQMLTKARKLKILTDKVRNDFMYNVFCDFDFKHRCLKQKTKMNRHIVSLERYEHIYEQSAFSALKFLSSIKTALCQIHLKLHSSQLSITESLNKEDVMELLSAIQIRERGNRRVRNQCLLKLSSGAEFHQSLTVPGVHCCFHISCVTSHRVWVSDHRNVLILTDTTGVPLYRVEDLCSGYGIHTVNSDSELIYIDRNYNINKLLKNMKTTITFIDRTDWSWVPRCVYWSPSTGDLLVGMHYTSIMTGKVTRYNQSGQLTQTIKHYNKGLKLYKRPGYITENNNGDVVVSDSDAVVVTQLGGRHRFSYTGHSTGSGLRPNGISTDALSHILVCDDKTKTVQMIDKDGQFLSHLLIRPSGIFSPQSLSYDVNTHRLWVGSGFNNTVVIYSYITSEYALTDLNPPTADVMESLSEIPTTGTEKPQQGNQCLLKLISPPELLHSLTVTGVDRCLHISCLPSDWVWVSDDRNNLILTDTTCVPLNRLKDSCRGLGSHTVNSESELIYIDWNYNINKLSKDMKTTTTFIERTDSTLDPRCVYWSPSTGDLLVGNEKITEYTETGKVTRYNQNRQLIQTMQYDNTGLALYRAPNYITENNNGDVVVSDFMAVVVTERGGKHRFSYTGHLSGSGLRPNGISTDALSHILVCDDKTKTVQMIDKDGQFLSHLLIRPSWKFRPKSLSYDVNTHRLWVGSEDNNTVYVYRYITREDTLTDRIRYRGDCSTPNVEY
nr:uncharacterized protein LOC105324463 isoform X2 [Crassostrea gigas]